jgi:AraC-like DNA-binding protein
MKQPQNNPAWVPRPSSDPSFPVNDGDASAEGWALSVLPAAVRARFRREKLISDCLVTDAGCFPRSAGHKAFRPKAEREAIVILCLSGRGWAADVESQDARRVPVKAREVLIIPPGAPHFYAADEQDPWSILWFHLSGSRALLFLDRLGVREGVAKGEMRNVSHISEPIRKLLELRRQGLTRAVLLEGNTLAELVLARLHAEASLAPLIERSSPDQHRITPDHAEKLRRVTGFIEANYTKDWRASELAQNCHVSESWLFHAFAAHTGFTPIGFLTHLRIQEACRLLLETPRKVADIASAVGYEDSFYFSRLFKKHIGQSPDSYRKENSR